ncbi:transposase, partial [Halomonas beimenensis]
MSGTDLAARLFADALIPLSPAGWHTWRMKTPPDLSQLTPDQLRHLAATLMSQVEQQEQALAQSQKTLRHTEQVNQKLSYELALLKRHAFGKRSEQLNVLQISLLDEV